MKKYNPVRQQQASTEYAQASGEVKVCVIPNGTSYSREERVEDPTSGRQFKKMVKQPNDLIVIFKPVRFSQGRIGYELGYTRSERAMYVDGRSVHQLGRRGFSRIDMVRHSLGLELENQGLSWDREMYEVESIDQALESLNSHLDQPEDQADQDKPAPRRTTKKV